MKTFYCENKEDEAMLLCGYQCDTCKKHSKKKKQKTKHGGKRKGAGRKKKEPTKTIRVPISKLKEILAILGKA